MMNASPRSPSSRSNRAGSTLAFFAAAFFVGSGLLGALTAAQMFWGASAADAAADTPALPVTFYAAWICATLGVVATVVTLFVVGYRARWFWWFLVAGAVLWLLLPPLGTAVGLVSLAILLGTRRSFPVNPREASPL